MALPLELAYSYILVAMAAVWAVVYYARKDLRQKMRRLTVLGAIAGPVSQLWYTADYWQPTYPAFGIGAQLVQDLAFAGLTFGLTATIYNVLFRKKSVPARGSRPADMMYGVPRGIMLAVLLVGILAVFTWVFHLNSIYSSAIGFVIVCLWMWHDRHDLIKPSLAGFAYLLVVTAVSYNAIFAFFPDLIAEWWLLNNISGMLLLGVPIEEFLWFSAWGMLGTPLYEWLYGFKFVRAKG